MVLRGLKLSYTSCNESTTINHIRRFQIQIEKVCQTCSSLMFFGYALIKNRLRGFERSFRCCGACKTKEDYKEGYLMVLCGHANCMSPCNFIVGLYFKGTCDVIPVSMAMHKVH